MSKGIYLGRNYWTIVDDHNFDLASLYTWHFQNGYAKTNERQSKNKKQKRIFLHKIIGINIINRLIN